MHRKQLPILATLVLLAGLVPAGVQAQSYAPGTLHSLASVEQFRDAFNADKERPRLVLLLSPT